MDHSLTEFNQGTTTSFLSRKSMSTYRQKWNRELKKKKKDQCASGGISPETRLLLNCQVLFGFGVLVFNTHCSKEML